MTGERRLVSDAILPKMAAVVQRRHAVTRQRETQRIAVRHRFRWSIIRVPSFTEIQYRQLEASFDLKEA